jgi:hypothetical protein
MKAATATSSTAEIKPFLILVLPSFAGAITTAAERGCQR